MEYEKDLNSGIEQFFDQYQGGSDLRSEEAKAKDYSQIEFVASAAPVNWVEKQPHEWRSFPVLNQFYTFKCVAFTIAKLALINLWLTTQEFLLFSPNSIYDRRPNKPEGGMVGNDAFEIWQESGISLEAVAKSNQTKETDTFFVSLLAKEIAKGFKLGNHITIPNGDFDRVASTLQVTGKGVMTWFFFTSNEWGRDFPVIMDNLPNAYVSQASRHSVTAVDFGLINGKEFLKIEDSAHFGGINIRYISREFFTARNFLIKYPMKFNYEEPITPDPTPGPVPTPRPSYSGSVASLQDCLKNYGTFPLNISSTGFMGNITWKAVRDFQVREGLHPTGVNIIGPRTVARLKLLYP